MKKDELKKANEYYCMGRDTYLRLYYGSVCNGVLARCADQGADACRSFASQNVVPVFEI